ncbi:glutamine-hydrolyzing carbamoyl-phosphate synthase small subunit [Candidatus Endowatersipora endosymbiont of Watersipora subatra]|uniref:glutamine-hydrolyzing carbamoyl-phosphate synthase small subunit n=1 Tax=Candidatus Endowatersipora endosymbiont of Watersipora subatra TaxID=3077946 RepID=UPI00312C8BBE
MYNNASSLAWSEEKNTGVLVLANGKVIEGIGAGATGVCEGEVCFNTSMTGYQEILTDPSYACQVIAFTFPHIGNVGVNDEDTESIEINSPYGAVGAIFRFPITDPSNHRSSEHLNTWLKKKNIITLCGIDTRALTVYIRKMGSPNAIIAHDPDGIFDIQELKARATAWGGIESLNLISHVTTKNPLNWIEDDQSDSEKIGPRYHIITIDFGVKRNILRLFTQLNCKVTIVPATTKAEAILSLKPDGIFLSNGPGDPAATGQYIIPEIQKLIQRKLPVFGICLGHQILALALGAQTYKMHQGHHGANHPIKDCGTGKVKIVSMNHSFAVDSQTFPSNLEETHISLFDGTNCGLRLSGEPVFSVQYHPESSPGPQDSYYLFCRFINMIHESKSIK